MAKPVMIPINRNFSFDEKFIAHLAERNGKYYFNPEVNDDDDVRTLAHKRDLFVQAHAKPATPAKAAKPAAKATKAKSTKAKAR